MMTVDPTTQIHDTGTESNIHIDWDYSPTIPTAQDLTPFGSEAIRSHIPSFSSSALSYSQPSFDNESQTLISLDSYIANPDTVSYDAALLPQFTQYDPDFGISGLSIIDPFDQPAQPETIEPTPTTMIHPAPKKRYPSYFPDSLANTLERGGNGKKSSSGITFTADGGPCDAKHVARGIVRYILYYTSLRIIVVDEGSVCSHIHGSPVTFARGGIAMFLVSRYSDRDGRRESNGRDSCLCPRERLQRLCSPWSRYNPPRALSPMIPLTEGPLSNFIAWRS